MDKLGIKWWLTDKPLTGLNLVKKTDKYYIYERSTALPIFWVIDEDINTITPEFTSVNWSSNSVTLQTAKPTSGTLIFGQTFYPGFKAYIGEKKEKRNVYKFQNLMAVDLASPSQKIQIKYTPSWLYPSITTMLLTSLIMIVLAVKCVLNLVSTKNSAKLNKVRREKITVDLWQKAYCRRITVCRHFV